MKTNTHLEIYCKQQNLDFIDYSNIKKSDLNLRELHLQERGSSKLAKNFLDDMHGVCATDNSFLTNLNKVRFALLKSGSHLPKNNCVIFFTESSFKMIKKMVFISS